MNQGQLTEQPMSDLQATILKRALAMLRTVGVQFKVIEPDGTEHGELHAVVEPPRARKSPKFGRFALRNHIQPFIEKINPGDPTTIIPYGPFDTPEGRKAMHGAVCARATHAWGTGGKYTTHANATGVEIGRWE